ncbi:DUF461 domain-containing protein [Streptomyces griseocarneus]|uniref:DUF461 domain-containing protein n=1 Tax=Streptomyces griseocarneus TaxID=51201 RepID=UPI00167C5588|nr:DUF461 domain-containing protein [Streptomyces griseocarneus]MBZ6473722.1 DUF461 domain-containing protein [Streptomyces griseocarneus]GHG64744.1 hypothetical protein GCM10018779_34900 [Streptomyces griseocarneus]
MSSSLRRGALAASALVLSIASLSACAAGNSAQTLEVKPDNAATSVGDIKLQNINVITQPDQKTEGPAVITGRLFNNGRKDQELRSITLAGKNVPVKLSGAKGAGKIVVPAGGAVTLGGKDNASAVLPKGREGIKDGESQNLSFDFSSTGEVKISAYVVPATSYFKEWGPTEAASPAAKPGGNAKPGASAPANPANPSGAPERPGTQPGGQTGATPAATGSPAQAGQPQPAGH